MAASTEALIVVVVATLPLPSPLTSYSSPLPQIPSPPFHVPSPPTTSPTYTKASLGYKATGIRLRTSSSPLLPLSSPLPIPPPIILPRTRASMVMTRAAAPSTYCLAPPSRTPPSRTSPLLPIPLPTLSPPLLLPFTDCRDDIPEVMLLPRKRLCIAPGPRYEIRESSSAPTAKPTRGFRADYGFVGTLDAEIRHDLHREIGYRIIDVWEDLDEIAKEIPATDVAELGQRMTNFVTIVRQDTDEIYVRLDNAQDDTSLMSGQLNLLRRDRRSYACTARLMESEARASREAWVQSMDASDTACSEVRALRLRWQHYRVSRDLLEIQHILMYRRRLVVVLRSGYVLAILYSLLSITGNSRLKMPPRKAPRSRTTPATTTATTPMTDAAIRALISRGVVDALAEK
ncbi:hypothetical protein Tco_0311701 [Tanacetum coccineum]